MKDILLSTAFVHLVAFTLASVTIPIWGCLLLVLAVLALLYYAQKYITFGFCIGYCILIAGLFGCHHFEWWTFGYDFFVFFVHHPVCLGIGNIALLFGIIV